MCDDDVVRASTDDDLRRRDGAPMRMLAHMQRAAHSISIPGEDEADWYIICCTYNTVSGMSSEKGGYGHTETHEMAGALPSHYFRDPASSSICIRFC